MILDPNNPDFWRPEEFCPLTKIRSKSGALVPFKLWDHQRILAAAVWRAYQEKRWLVHVKPRQEGSSTFFTAIATQHACFRSGCLVGILAHKRGAAQQLANIAIRTHKTMHPSIRPRKTPGLKRSLELPDLDSRVLIESVKSEEPMRGHTVQVLLATEISSWSETAGPEAWTSALNAVSDDGGFVIGESTPKYHGDELHQVCLEAEDPDSKWMKVFIPWTMVNEYSLNPHPGWKPSQQVREYWDNHPSLTTGQAYWMNRIGLAKCRNDIVRFQAEYPINELECWALAGDAVYDNERLLKRLNDIDGGTGVMTELHEFESWEEPKPRHKYVIACDPAGSWAKRDKTAIVCLDVNECAQVAEYLGHDEAHRIAKRVVDLANKYNRARVYIEANGVGEAVVSHVLAMGYNNVYFRSTSGRTGKQRSPGWYSNLKTKAQAESYLQELIIDGSMCIRSVRALRQLMNYRGQWSKLNRDSTGGHFDLAAAFALVAWAWRAEVGSGTMTRNKKIDPNVEFRRLLERIERSSYKKSNSRWGEHL